MIFKELITNYFNNLKLYQKCFLISGVLFNIFLAFGEFLSIESFFLLFIFLLLPALLTYIFSAIPTVINIFYPHSKQERKHNLLVFNILIFISLLIFFFPKDIFKGKIILSAYNKQDSPNGGAFWVNFRGDSTFEVNIVSFLGTGETFEGRYTMINDEITLLNEYPRLPKKFIIRNEKLFWIVKIDGKEQESPSRFLIITKNEMDKL